MELPNDQNDWTNRSIIITGANRGIGYAAVENILKAGKYSKIIITSRSQESAEAAIKKIAADHGEDKAKMVSYLVLDLKEKCSIDKFIADVKEQHGQVDTLLNNAGVFTVKENSKEVLDWDLFINFTQTKYLLVNFLQEKALKRNGKIIVTSSIAAQLKNMRDVNPEFYEKVKDYEKLSFEDLKALVEEYKEGVIADGTKWPMIYFSSKMFISIFLYLLGKEEKVNAASIQVYSVHPGFIETDMSIELLAQKNMKAPQTLEDGGNRLAYLSHLPFEIHEKFQGRHFENDKVNDLRSE